MACLVALALPAAAQDLPERRHEDRIVAIVEGEPITMYELELTCRLYPGYVDLRKEAPGSREKYDFQKQVLADGVVDPRGQRELSLIEQKVLLARAKEGKLELSAQDEERLNQDLARTAERYRGGMDGLRADLRQLEVPFEFYLARKRSSLLITKLLLANVSHAIFPTPSEVRRRYEEQRARWQREGQLRLRQLRIDLDPEEDSLRSLRDLDPEVKTRLSRETWDGRAFAHELRAKISAGALPFEDAQRKFSMGPYHDQEQVFAADQDLTAVFRSPLPEQIARLGAGELSQVIESHDQRSFYLVLVVDRTQRGVVPLEEVQEEIEFELKDQVWLRRRNAWIAEVRSQAHVELFFREPNDSGTLREPTSAGTGK